MSSVWASGVWAAGLWASGVWYESGVPAEEPEQQAVTVTPGLYGRHQWTKRQTRVEHYPQGGFTLRGSAAVAFRAGPVPVEPLVVVSVWAPHELHEPDYAAAEVAMAKGRKRKAKIKRADTALLGIA